ncbi:FecCD family ABC transporter permease [Mesopusillimonas faecipullorum]|nr:iron ABC transporter permease [Mesopusillimonas faecipullorum]
MALASASGAYPIALQDLPRVLWWPTEQDTLAHRVLVDVRLPRVVLSMTVGAGLAIAGACMQALFRNPLADPGLIGISSGAAVGAVGAIVLGVGGFFSAAGAAFAGSLLATWCAYVLGRRSAGMAGLLLAGIAINAACGSAIGLFSYMADDSQLRSLTFWNLGSLAHGSWSILVWLTPWTFLLSVLLYRHWRALNALLIGEREAWHLGFSLTRVRRELIGLVALLVGPLVAATGVIGFVGLVIPHVLRLLMGADHRALLPASALGGAIALVVADWGARIIMVPAELPVGIVTSLIGAPFFLWLINRVGRRRTP